MGEMLHCGRVTDLTPLIAKLDMNGDAYVLLERVPIEWIDEKTPVMLVDRFDRQCAFDAWTRGRVFSAGMELRWERFDDSYRVVYVGPQAAVAGLAAVPDLDLSAHESRDVLYDLWGKRVENPSVGGAPAGARVFVELRIPRLLHYPVSAGARLVRLAVREYYDRVTGALALYRFRGLEEVS